MYRNATGAVGRDPPEAGRLPDPTGGRASEKTPVTREDKKMKSLWILVVVVAAALLVSGCMCPGKCRKKKELEERVSELERKLGTYEEEESVRHPQKKSLEEQIAELDNELEVLRKDLGPSHKKIMDREADRDRLAEKLKARKKRSSK